MATITVTGPTAGRRRCRIRHTGPGPALPPRHPTKRVPPHGSRKQDGAAKRHLNLTGTDLRGAILEGAHLEDADLRGTHLERAGLTNAHLQYADLRKAQLQGAHLMGSRFTRAHLEGANLGEVHGLTPGRLDGADGDATTKVADELRPAHWPAAAAGVPDNPG